MTQKQLNELRKYSTTQIGMMIVSNIGWFTDDRLGWQIEFDKLSHVDFQRLNIDKDKLYDILQNLYEWRVIR